MSFHEQSFATRFQSMGDQCEGVFEAVHVGAWDRYGLNRPSSSMKTMPARVRNTPDYVTSNGYIECKGVGKDQTLKLKLEVINCMWFWHNTWDLQTFIWDSHNKRYTYMTMTQLQDLINDHKNPPTLGHFDKDTTKPKAFFGLDLKRVVSDWLQPAESLELAA